jgi:cell division protein FtsA
VAMAGLKHPDQKIEVLGYSIAPSRGIKRGVVSNVNEAMTVLNQVISQMEDKFNGEIKRLDVAIAGQYMKSRIYRCARNIAEKGVVTREVIDSMIEEANSLFLGDDQNIYHLMPLQYLVDGEVVTDKVEGSIGRKIEAVYLILSAPENYKFDVEMVLDQISVDLNKMIMSPVATAEAVLDELEKEVGVVLVDIGGGSTKLAIYYNGVLCHSAVIPFGGNVITNDIKEGCSIQPKMAEQLKIQYGQAMGDFADEDKVVTIPGVNGWEPKEISFKSLAYIIQARLEEIVDSVYYQIENSGYLEKLGAGIVLTGGTSNLPNLVQLVRYRTGLDARIGRNVIPLTNKESDLHRNEFLTSLGLLKLSCDDADNNGNSKYRGAMGIRKSPGFIKGTVSKMREKVSQGIFNFFDDTDDEL